MDWRLRQSRYRFISSMESIVDKYNFAFEDDIVVSIKSLTYQTQDGPRIWGEDDEILDVSYENSIQCQENIVRKQNSDFEEDSTDDQTFEEGQFTSLIEESQLSPDSKGKAELASVKCQLANIHIQATKPKSIFRLSPLQQRKKLENKSLIGYDTVQRKQLSPLSLRSPELNDAAFTLHSPVKNSLASNTNYGGSVSSGHGFLATSVADMEESGISDMNENIPRYLREREFSRKSQNFIPKVSRKLSYNDGRIRSNELIQKDYEETFLEGFGEENDIF
ncbi:hypothetical protein NXF25_010620 [Crotalus adamanteus]|uniref:Uncharacterized protein n=1 Tax=Crotalus adamanteus TaxID=8729 RepID=A0AAW1BJM3_CROAD